MSRPSLEAVTSFTAQVQSYLGSRYGDAWITTRSDGTRLLNVGVVTPDSSDAATIASFAGQFAADIQLVPVEYSLDQLATFAYQLTAALLRSPGYSTTPPLVQVDGSNHKVTSVGRSPKENKVIIATGGLSKDSSTIPASIPTNIPSNAYRIDTANPAVAHTVVAHTVVTKSDVTRDYFPL